MSAITKFLGIKITDCELGVFGSLDFLAKDEDIYNRLKTFIKSKNSGEICGKEVHHKK